MSTLNNKRLVQDFAMEAAKEIAAMSDGSPRFTRIKSSFFTRVEERTKLVIIDEIKKLGRAGRTLQ